MSMSKTSPFLHQSLSSPPSPLEEPPYPMRSSSEFDLSHPPRYSTLIGTFPRSNPTQPDDGATSLPSLRPPAYSSVFQRRGHSAGPADVRPSTASSPNIQRSQSLFPTSSRSHSLQPQSSHGVHKHQYHIIANANKAKPWATLKVYSQSSTSLDKQKMPHFTEGDLIRGAFELNLDTPQNINSISLSLRGRITTSFYENGSYIFLDHPITSWSRSDGDPRSMFFMPETTIKKFDGKLSGQYTWPFMLAFPKDVTIRGQHQYLSKTYPTPQSYLEHGTNTTVQYELILRVTHGMLRADSKLNVDILYVPNITPEPFSLLREAAHRRNARLPRPDEDPEGWFTLPHANVHGKLFNDRHAHLRCTLSLAKPECYPRGSMIPCHLRIHSTNIEALDVLASHKSIRVCLVRRIHFYEDPKQAYTRTQQSLNDQVPPGVIEQVETIERAVWWTSNSEEPDTRCLEGEIHLDRELQPTSQFLLFKVSYTVELYPFESRVFKCTNSGFAITDNTMRKAKAFMSHPVTIATQHLQGQVPVPLTKIKAHPRKRIEFPPPEFSFRSIWSISAG